jgi:hypothetical protein
LCIGDMFQEGYNTSFGKLVLPASKEIRWTDGFFTVERHLRCRVAVVELVWASSESTNKLVLTIEFPPNTTAFQRLLGVNSNGIDIYQWSD